MLILCNGFKICYFNISVSYLSAAAIDSSAKEIEAVIEDFKDADETETHAESDEAAGVADEADGRHAHVLLDQRVVRVLDEDVEDSEVLLSVAW